jgi:hypothetical protein
MISNDDSPIAAFCRVIDSNKARINTASISDTNQKHTTKSDNDGVVDVTKFHKKYGDKASMIFYAIGDNITQKLRPQRPPVQPLALELMYGSIQAPPIDIQSQPKSKFDETAVAYTREEYQILKLDKISNDVRAAVIWHAIERDQMYGEFENPKCSPLSSAEILQHLYKSKLFGDEVTRKSSLSDDDAMLIHSSDAIFHHYKNDSNKINPFELSRFSLDTSIAMDTDMPLNVKEYFKVEIAKSTNSFKMKFGHKIASSILTSASHMHLNFHNRHQNCLPEEYIDECKEGGTGLASDIEFVTDIMRLMAARWREEGEVSGKSLSNTSKKEAGSNSKSKGGSKANTKNGAASRTSTNVKAGKYKKRSAGKSKSKKKKKK